MPKLVRKENRIDPRDLGATCDACPLREMTPVPPTQNATAKLIVLGESPGRDEEFYQKPFVGQSGQLLDKVFERVGVRRVSCHVTNALLCRPHSKMSPSQWKQALACCAPRLQRELAGVAAKTILALGGKAQQAVTGKAKITDWMGSPLKVHETFGDRTCLSTIHPAFVLRGKPEYVAVLRIHTDRAWQLALGKLLPYTWPEIVIGPTEHGNEKEVIAALKRIKKAKKVGCDVETADIDPLSDLLNVGFGSYEVGLAVSVFWQTATTPIRKLVAEILASEKIEKVFHNGAFDVVVLENN